ncbi:hypothetical protein MiSe_52160 [Microseira wollei NIES-4236]|uniref:Uncharacterized protein n=1 Tax=Microseira wollei NIES-4236 TaxID=2530354 RepID=A0AAV3XLK7_9CYAN|nr:hypothetical protein MiSe_52160 [Microseira wollei NIES-4236]
MHPMSHMPIPPTPNAKGGCQVPPWARGAVRFPPGQGELSGSPLGKGGCQVPPWARGAVRFPPGQGGLGGIDASVLRKKASFKQPVALSSRNVSWVAIQPVAPILALA